MRITQGQLRQLIRGILQENNQKTLTPEFRRWFGRSMLVDPAGNPIKLYHGTRGSFNVFRPSASGNYGPGIYLSASKLNASDFSRRVPAGAWPTGGRSVMPLYVRLINPLILSQTNAGIKINTISGVLSDRHEALQEKLATTASSVSYMGGAGEQFALEVQTLGHDGIIVDFSGFLDDPGVAEEMAKTGMTREEISMAEVIVYDSHQLKSALGNPGTYDPENPSIVTEAKLRQTIREELLHEIRVTPDNLPDGITLKLNVTAGGSMIIVNAWWGSVLGTVEAHRTRSKRSPCRGAYQVMYSRSFRKGLGPLLYDIAMEAASEIGGGLMSDRDVVSDAAQRVWSKYQNDRPDVTYLRLDSEENERTDPLDDNCNVLNAKAHAGDDWYDHPLAGVYRKPGMETIRRLVSMKRLQVDGMDI